MELAFGILIITCLALAIMLPFLLKKVATSGGSLPVTAEWIDELSVERYRPMLRLLDGADLEFLRSQPGFNNAMAIKLRAQRCQIFRGYLRCLDADFGRVCGAIKVLMLQSLLWDDEVREADFSSLKEDVRVSAQELKMASSLIESMGADFDPSDFHDEYKDAVEALIESKKEHGDAKPAPVEAKREDEGDSMTDLLSALQASVDAARGRSGSAAPKEEEQPEPKPARTRRKKADSESKDDGKPASTRKRRTAR